ncbi:MAG: prepilin-type N-terminal cleavage/methylation domain-containing protein [Verrucomicrobiales bacterium]|nr:prepilin-type N-terminal cleavage/methylation domain-containing protein [Verrucomicrobiales bacterium]
MKLIFKSRRSRGGFILLEVILALAIFGLVSVGITRALKQIGEVAVRSGEELRIQRKLESWLTRYSKADFRDQDFRSALPIEGEIAGAVFDEVSAYADQMGVDYYAYVEPLEDMYTLVVREPDGDDREVPLGNMFRIRIEAIWGDSDQERIRVAETIRYESLYQNR